MGTQLTPTDYEVAGSPFLVDARLLPDLAALHARVQQMRSQGRLTKDVLERIRKFFRIKHIYNSNAIEGNALTVGETRVVVEDGLTLTGKPLKDQAEARSLSHALDFLEDLATATDRAITEADIRQIHALVLKGIQDAEAGSYRTVEVEISGSAYKPNPPESIAAAMEVYGQWLSQSAAPGATDDPIVIAAAAHAWLVQIHPFIDGNGRVSRLVMNLLLMRAGYPIAVITKDDRSRYYDALEQSQAGDLSSVVALLMESVEESLEEYERAVEQHREYEEWAKTIAGAFTDAERTRAQNEYELWKSAMELLKSYFRQTAEVLSQQTPFGHVYFVDFGTLEFEKYASLRQGVSAKRTWFFRIDFRAGDRAARYLFFFGTPSHGLREDCDVTAWVAREGDRPYFYERLDTVTAPNVPSLLEVGYRPAAEKFVARYRDGTVVARRVEEIGRQFIEQLVSVHFSSRR